MNFRETTGLLFIVAGSMVLPTAWMFSRALWLVAGVLIFAGAFLFYTARVRKRHEQLDRETGSGGGSGPGIPGDVHNFSGWRTGGRSETMDGDSGGGGGD